MLDYLKNSYDIFCRNKNWITFAWQFKNGGVVQLVRMPACHAGGREFESRRHRNKEKPRSVGFCFVARSPP